MLLSTYNKTTIILKALMRGHTIVIGARSYCFSDENVLCCIGTNVTLNEPVLLSVNFGDVTISNFINFCDSATDDEIIAIGANVGLTELNRGK